MKPETFFEKFDLLADAPDAVARMRELVRHLAVQGRLVPQCEDDEPSSKLAAQIAADRTAFVGEQKLSRQCVFEEKSDDERPFALPERWKWTRLGNLCRVQAGFAFASAAFVQGSSGVPMIRIRDITSDRTQVNYTGEYRDEFLVDPGDYLVGMDGNFTVAKWGGPRALLNQRVSRLQWYSRRLQPAFFAIAVQHRLTELQGTKAYTTVDHLSSKQIEDAIVPLPPLAEQKRIVAKVDELMALCGRLEALQQERETRHAALARASLARFAEAPTPANLDFLFHKSYAIPPVDLRKSILTLAFAGKLAPQDPADEPASILLEKARAEKARLIEAGHVKREPWADKLQEAATLYELPSGWEWTHISDVVEKVTVGFVGSMKEQYRRNGVPFLRSQNVRENRYEPVGLAFITEEFHRSISKSTLRPGDVVVTRSGNVGVTCVIPESLPEANCSDLVIVKRPLALIPEFLSYFINSIAGGQIEAKTVGIALTHFNTQSVAQMTVALPPLAEQRRIVAKVDELMALVDQLEEQLSTAKKKGMDLLEAVVHELLSPSAEIIPFPSASAAPLPDREAIGCYAIQRLAGTRTFGRTTQVKVLYLSEAHVGMGLGGSYVREAAGPLDRWIYTFEEQAAEQQWFSVVESATKDGRTKVEYRKGPKLSAKAKEVPIRLQPELRKELDRLLDLMANKPTETVEIIATLFAAWNDALIDGHTPSDAEIIRDVRENWHPSKQRFKEPELKKWLGWMRQHALVPKGRGPHTRGSQATLRLH